ncbi:SDR family oxidoreductase [Mycobacteroides sp. CBMA 326]|uniref:SDR family NAD(P)-dependent oxidoreductase n=1 Tax=Mycobacteroides sp. CBMA 326 TaxID=1904945 RepID=UPI00193CD231|nr:SDR family oxidoreductase [Mycobacteroides sp. CBMA 326]
MSNRFRGATAIVTGAASGIGRALCELLIDRGAVVWAADRDGVGLASLAAECGSRLKTAVIDVADRESVAALVDQAVWSSGRLDLMFNNAGIVVGGDLAEMTTEVWRQIVDVNFWGVVHGTQLAYAQMRDQGVGHIVNTSSSAGLMPVASSAAYAATKHAVVGLTTSLRAEAKPYGVRASVVVPGLVDTGIFDKAHNLPGYDYRASVDAVPFAKISPERAAEAILRGVARNQQFITFPAYNRILVRLNRIAPSLMSPIINYERNS